MQPKDFSIQEISVGDNAFFERVFDNQDVLDFARLSGDYNPLHLDDAYAKKTKFGGRIVYGMLLGSLCSRLVGMYLPGKKCLYLKQSLVFKNPVFINDRVTVFGEVKKISLSTKIMEIEIIMKKKNRAVVEGMAVVQII